MMAYNWMEVVSLALNLIFGGGFIITFLTIRAQKKKASAEAKGAEASAESTELDNVEKAIRIWREMAENFKTELTCYQEKYADLARQVEGLRREVKKLNTTNQKILNLLDMISHDNLESTVAEIKSEIQKTDA